MDQDEMSRQINALHGKVSRLRTERKALVERMELLEGRLLELAERCGQLEEAARVRFRMRVDEDEKETIEVAGGEDDDPSKPLGFTSQFCACELRNRAWDPTSGRCRACGCYFNDKRYPLVLEVAKALKVCRFCRSPERPGDPFVLNFGKEYAHQSCWVEPVPLPPLPEQSAPVIRLAAMPEWPPKGGRESSWEAKAGYLTAAADRLDATAFGDEIDQVAMDASDAEVFAKYVHQALERIDRLEKGRAIIPAGAWPKEGDSDPTRGWREKALGLRVHLEDYGCHALGCRDPRNTPDSKCDCGWGFRQTEHNLKVRKRPLIHALPGSGSTANAAILAATERAHAALGCARAGTPVHGVCEEVVRLLESAKQNILAGAMPADPT